MSPQMVGLVGGIAGSVIGLLGGAIGTYFSIKNTRTDAERHFQVRCAAAIWVMTLVLIVAPLPLVALQVIPRWMYWVGFAAYMISVQQAIPWMNRRANELRGLS